MAIGTAEAHESIKFLFRQATPDRYEFLRALNEESFPVAIQILTELLVHDRHPAAATALANARAIDVAPKMLNLLGTMPIRSRTDRILAFYMTRALGKIGDSSAISVIDSVAAKHPQYCLKRDRTIAYAARIAKIRILERETQRKEPPMTGSGSDSLVADADVSHRS